MKTAIKRFVVSLFRIVFFCHLWFWGAILVFSLLYQFVNPPLTLLMLHRHFLRGYEWQKKEFIPLAMVPKRAVRMVLLLEDPDFYNHWGFNWNMVRRAWKKNRQSGRIRFGASTISNQLARTIFLTTHRNYFRKYLEAQITLLMELVMTKDRMLELYLNYVEWGPGIYGIESASRHYYKTGIRALTPSQTMRLVSILSSPIKHSPKDYSRSRSARQRYRILDRVF